MIASTAGGHGSFGRAIGYIAHPDKTERIEVQHVMGGDAQEITREMQAEVRQVNEDRPQQEQITTPVYHVSISWSPEDDPTVAEKMQIGREFLAHMGLEEHQAVIASHTDRPYDHIHIVANRIHPQTGQRWEPYLYDGTGRDRHIVQTEYGQHEAFLREQERAHGWAQVPGVHAENPERDFDRTQALTQGEYYFQQKAQQTAEAFGMPEADTRPIKERACELMDALYSAESFKEFDQALVTNGLWIESKGQGAVISDGSYSVKASSISRGLSGPQLEKKFGEKLADYEEHREADIDPREGEKKVKEFITVHREKVGDAVAHQSSFKVDSHAASIITLEKFNRELTPARMRFRQAIATTFENPEAAMEKFGKRAGAVGMEQARQQFIRNPSQFGSVANQSNISQTNGAIERLQNILNRYSSELTSKTDSERSELINIHQIHKAGWNKLKGQAQKMANEAMRESQGGEAAATGGAKAIEISRGARQLAISSEKGSLQQVQQMLSKAQARMQGDSGQAVGSIMQGAMRGSKTVKQLLTNPTRGGIRMMQHILTGGQRAAGRAGRGLGQ